MQEGAEFAHLRSAAGVLRPDFCSPKAKLIIEGTIRAIIFAMETDTHS